MQVLCGKVRRDRLFGYNKDMNPIQNISKIVKHHWLTIAFIIGFFSDVLLLNQVDNIVDNAILVFYTVLASLSIICFYIGVAERSFTWLNRLFVRYAPIAMQYSFGGLLSGMLIFYGRSGDWLASWPFLLLIITVIFGNELVEKRSDRLVYQLGLYFIGLLSFTVLELPVVLGKMGDSIFILSGLIALVWVTIVVQLLHRIVPHFVTLHIRRVIVTIGLTYVGFNALYFANIIPPIPLSLTELEIAQSVTRVSGGYRLELESQPWYAIVPFVQDTLHPKYETISCFSRVFAPTKLSTKIYHRWEYKDATGNWQTHARIGYDIAGSNVHGYGGYTTIGSFSAGQWRCSVETARGQVLGRMKVTIDPARIGSEMITVIK